MKKYIALFSVTILIISAIVYTPTAISMFLPRARLVMLSEQTYSEYVSANGSVTEKSIKNISTEYPIVPKKINFEVGDDLKAGEVIATVDKTATQSAIMQIYQTAPEMIPANLSNAISKSSGDTEAISQLIPDKILSNTQGRITSLNISVGVLCNPGVIATISDVDNLCVKVSINESDISKIKRGQKAEITGAAFGSKQYTGTISKIFPTATKQIVSTSQQTVVDVLIDLDKCDKDIKVGFTACANIKVSDEKKINILPYESISQDDDGNEYVFVYKNGRARKKNIVTGISIKSGQQILKGITKNDFVIYKSKDINDDDEYVSIILNPARGD